MRYIWMVILPTVLACSGGRVDENKARELQSMANELSIASSELVKRTRQDILATQGLLQERAIPEDSIENFSSLLELWQKAIYIHRFHDEWAINLIENAGGLSGDGLIREWKSTTDPDRAIPESSDPELSKRLHEDEMNVLIALIKLENNRFVMLRSMVDSVNVLQEQIRQSVDNPTPKTEISLVSGVYLNNRMLSGMTLWWTEYIPRDYFHVNDQRMESTNGMLRFSRDQWNSMDASTISLSIPDTTITFYLKETQ